MAGSVFAVRTLCPFLAFSVAAFFACASIQAQSSKSTAAPGGKTKIILDADIGDDVDDAFALGLALHSPEIEIIGITTAWGDTALRARMVRRMLLENGTATIPVAEGIVTDSKTKFSQGSGPAKGQMGRS